ncbi:MAG TPA: DUF3570 domain-containing protein [Gammaproteobacteria bacterium]
MAVTRVKSLLSIILLSMSFSTQALVLPEDRFDTLYHSYDGGGITVNGPSILVRKNLADSVSVSANYYVDSISSASIDVETRASKYSEERTQYSASADYLHDKSIISYSYTTSEENDYEATTSNFSISQEMFGGLTTVSLGFKLGNNIIRITDNDLFRKENESRGYRLTASQVLTKNMLLGLAYEITTDEGFLNNPYREIRYDDGSGVSQWDLEVYPNTRTSNALGFSLRYFLPHRAAVYGGYRYFIDSWDIEADTFDVGYVFPHEDKWLFELTYRYYSQNNAEFYSDLFTTLYTYMARDKELSTYNSHSIGLGATYKLGSMGIFEKGSVNFIYNYFVFDYQDFRDIPEGLNTGAVIGQEPLYELKANVIRFYLSFWF